MVLFAAWPRFRSALASGVGGFPPPFRCSMRSSTSTPWTRPLSLCRLECFESDAGSLATGCCATLLEATQNAILVRRRRQWS
eukprot:16432216-Heterocapsa_arctica.AAC.1